MTQEKALKMAKLSEVCAIMKGKNPILYNAQKHNYLPYLSAKFLRGHADAEFADIRDKKSITVTKNDIIIICDGSNSGDSFYGFEGILSSTMGKVVNNTSIDTEYLLYFLIEAVEYLKSKKTGTAIPHLDIKGLLSLEIPLPPLSEQHRIVKILDEVFAGIAKAKANTEKNLQNAKELFESYLENIFIKPAKVWEVQKLSEVCEKITDGTHQTPKYFDSGYIFLSSRNVASGKINWEKIKYIDHKQHLEMHKRVAPRKGDILLAKNGTTGVAAMVDKDVDFDIYVSLALLRSKGNVLPNFLLYFINSPVAKKQFNKRLKGSGVPNLHLEEIREVVIHYPESLAEQKSIVAKLDALSAQTKKLEAIYQQKLADLEELKKSVLKKAFAGEL